MVFFGNDKGSVIAAGTDGKIKWQYEGGVAAEAPPMVSGNLVIIGFNDGTLHAINKATGKPVWKYKTDSQIAGSANAWSTGKRSGIVIGSYDYYLHSVDPLTGRLQWKLETQNYVNGTPAVSNNNIIFGGCDGFIRVVDAYSGREKDTIQIGTYIASSPALSGGKACFGDYDGNFFCVDLLTGKIAWEIPASETSGSVVAIPAIGRNSVIIGNEDKYLILLRFNHRKTELEIQDQWKDNRLSSHHTHKSDLRKLRREYIYAEPPGREEDLELQCRGSGKQLSGRDKGQVLFPDGRRKVIGIWK